MGCGTSAKTATTPSRTDDPGATSKADIVLEKKFGFSENYSLDKSLGFGKMGIEWGRDVCGSVVGEESHDGRLAGDQDRQEVVEQKVPGADEYASFGDRNAPQNGM